MVPVRNYSMSPGSLLVDGVVPHRIRHHHQHQPKPQSKNVTTTTAADTCYCTPFM